MVSFTHGEGFGRPLLEATMTGLPVMATNWSGQLDFLDNDKTLLLPGNLEDVPRKLVDNQLIVEGSKWFKVNQGYTHKFFEHSFKNINELKVKANQLMKKNVEKFSLENMTKKFDEIMEKYTKDMPQQVSLNLPKLKKVDKTKAKPVMELPKLKKVSDGVKV
jgi:glycosyltransferase involved in cell wall biosynthesis